MAEWPVRVAEKGSPYSYPDGKPKPKPESVPPGEAVEFYRFNTRHANGETSFGGMIVQCPRCGQFGSCAADRWSFEWGGDGKLSMSPSIVCTMPVGALDDPRCSGHYWLTDGVLWEVWA